jgi:hypothetical protein
MNTHKNLPHLALSSHMTQINFHQTTQLKIQELRHTVCWQVSKFSYLETAGQTMLTKFLPICKKFIDIIWNCLLSRSTVWIIKCFTNTINSYENLEKLHNFVNTCRLCVAVFWCYLFYVTCVLTFLRYPRSWVLFTHINSHTVHYHLLSATGHCWYIIPKMVISLMVLHRIPRVDHWTLWTWSC